MKPVTVGDIAIGSHSALTLIAGPCQIEGLDHALRHAEAIMKAAEAAGIKAIYKSSFDKANRTSASAKRGVGLEEGIAIWQR